MQPKFNLDQYLTEGVEAIVKDALAASLKNPKETAFLFTYALAAKRAANTRESFAAKGKHIPSFLIASITNRCNLHCAGCYARANSICDDAETTRCSRTRTGAAYLRKRRIWASRSACSRAANP